MLEPTEQITEVGSNGNEQQLQVEAPEILMPEHPQVRARREQLENEAMLQVVKTLFGVPQAIEDSDDEEEFNTDSDSHEEEGNE